MASGILIKLGHEWWARVRLGVSPDVFSISLNIPLLETMLNCVNESAKLQEAANQSTGVWRQDTHIELCQ